MAKEFSNDYFKLFVKRESKVVLGKNYSNLWLLCAVLTATFLAIGFSNASLKYLDFKMNDPFINWVDIKNPMGDSDFNGFVDNLASDTTLVESFDFKGYQTDKYWFTTFFTASSDAKNLRCRYFADITTPLVDAIMDKSNVVDNRCIAFDKRENESFGIIITEDALRNKLGYEQIPAYLNYWGYCDEEAEEFGVEIFSDGIGSYAKVPVPIIAVVKRLPTNMDIIGTKHFYLQNLVHSLNLYNPSYASSLIYFIPSSAPGEAFNSRLKELAEGAGLEDFYIDADEEKPAITPWKDGLFTSLRYYDEDYADYSALIAINAQICEEFSSKGIQRVYCYDFNDPMWDTDDYVSIHFNGLGHIREFQDYVKKEFNIDIEMSQINAKENFNEVSMMANILSWTMIIFAIVCIILFIVNLLQSYFQKVKRNLGTFKAFGIGNRSLIGVYVLIMVAIVVVATLIALIITGGIQAILPVLGIMKDGSFNYIDLGSMKTLWSIIIILLSTTFTVYSVMQSLLKVTPGDLIYDR